MATVVNSFALDGVNAYQVIVETVTLHGQPSVNIVGDPLFLTPLGARLITTFNLGNSKLPQLSAASNR